MGTLATLEVLSRGLKTAMDIAKALRDADTQIKTADLKLQLAEMMGALADAKVAVVDVQGELAERTRRRSGSRKLFATRSAS